MSLGADLTRFLRFAAVGGGFSLFYAVTCAVLVGPLGFPAYATAVILYILCIPAAFFAQMRLTFELRRTRAVGFPVYAGTQVISLALVSLITTRFVTGEFWIDTLVFLISAGSAAVISYFVCSRIAFKPE